MAGYIKDKDGVLSNALDEGVTVPSDRNFRDSWVLNGNRKVITEDLATAKTLFKEKIREVRKPLLEALDVVYMQALEAGNSSAQTTAKNKKQALRDAPAASDITNASNITELKAAWDTSILGSSPY